MIACRRRFAETNAKNSDSLFSSRGVEPKDARSQETLGMMICDSRAHSERTRAQDRSFSRPREVLRFGGSSSRRFGNFLGFNLFDRFGSVAGRIHIDVIQAENFILLERALVFPATGRWSERGKERDQWHALNCHVWIRLWRERIVNEAISQWIIKHNCEGCLH